MHKIRTFLPYAGGYLACVALNVGVAFLFGYLTHTGIFA